jgi:hypothetical protein
VADLSIADKLLHDALDADAGPAHTGYQYRQLLARLFEARPPVVTLDCNPEIRSWVESLDGIDESLRILRGPFLPVGSSPVDDAYGDVRNRSVHHSWVGSPELAEMLTLARDEEAWIVLDHEQERLQFEWPETVVMTALFGDLRDSVRLKVFLDRVQLAKTVLKALMNFGNVAIPEHASRVHVDPSRYVRRVRRGPSTPAWL